MRGDVPGLPSHGMAEMGHSPQIAKRISRYSMSERRRFLHKRQQASSG